MTNTTVTNIDTYLNPYNASTELFENTDSSCSEELGTAIQKLIQKLRQPIFQQQTS